MNISISTIAYRNYGKFLPQWLEAVSKMSPQPSEIVVTLGFKHNTSDLAKLRKQYPTVQFYQCKEKPSFGKLRNVGISNTRSEWVFFVSVDDTPEPDAIETFQRALDKEDGDYICAQWYREGILEGWYESPLPIEMVDRIVEERPVGFIIPHSPYRRKFWEMSPYKETDLPNYDFVKNCLLNGAKFIKADKPTTIYKSRPHSHSRTTLKRHTVRIMAQKEQAKFHKAIVGYYK